VSEAIMREAYPRESMRPRRAGPDPLPRKSPAQRARARALLAALRTRYPDAHCELTWTAPHELLVATILSAQSTDVGVNRATPGLFRAFPAPADYARAGAEGIAPHIRSLNFWRMKARAVAESMAALVDRHGGEVPQSMEALTALRGVARKTANVVLGNVFGINEGVVVDTHVGRLSRRLGLSRHDDPARVERDLMALFPQECWCELSHLLIFHGRRVCKARGGTCADDAICRRFCSEAAPKAARRARAATAAAAEARSPHQRASTRPRPSPRRR
jgi:endonuclease-3